jgi:hypothetical protein
VADEVGHVMDLQRLRAFHCNIMFDKLICPTFKAKHAGLDRTKIAHIKTRKRPAYY